MLGAVRSVLMLNLPVHLRDLLLAKLNQAESIFAWQVLLGSDAGLAHRDRERQPYDTTFSDLHWKLRAFVNARLGEVRYDNYGLTGATLLGASPNRAEFGPEERWLPCVDVFALWTATERDPKWVRHRVGRRPLSAFRVGTSVAYLAGNETPVWRWRRWRGTRQDPLLRLPYQRKYDWERHHAADEQLRWHNEKLRIALDILQVLAERVHDLPASSAGLRALQLADIQRELGRMGLGLGGGDLLLPAGLELCQMRMEHTERRGAEPRIDFTIAEGRYSGVLGGYHRRPSGALRLPPSAAGKKWILTRPPRSLI